MARRRFFVSRVRAGHAELEGEAAEHLRRVLRAERGQRFEISDNDSVYLAEIDGLGKGKVTFRVIEPIMAELPPVRITLLAAIFKFDRFEWIVEKATELGVETIVPVEAERSEKALVRAAVKRVDRWRRVTVESSQQARRARLPEVTEPVAFRTALGTGGDYRYFLDELRAAAPILPGLPEPARRQRSDTICLLVGPEGGWTEGERTEALDADWQSVSLGSLILRAETAAVAALAVIANAWYAGVGDVRGGAGNL